MLNIIAGDTWIHLLLKKNFADINYDEAIMQQQRQIENEVSFWKYLNV